MDGHFVPNLTFGTLLVKCLRKKVPNAFFGIHDYHKLTNDNFWVGDMADAGADQYTFHLEATDKLVDLINQIKEAGMKVNFLIFFVKVCIGIKPNTSVEAVMPFVKLVDMVLVDSGAWIWRTKVHDRHISKGQTP
ncbi:unnamed protein product [Pocillopora meandrina]|uniref:Uncharacterized protein n=1 Tax=Pocillopora meandrina TaxID=46732 RepID=A0AAU9WVB9_9CNID|nr:unnamed protein product [Pocillopora meandrina]